MNERGYMIELIDKNLRLSDAKCVKVKLERPKENKSNTTIPNFLLLDEIDLRWLTTV